MPREGCRDEILRTTGGGVAPPSQSPTNCAVKGAKNTTLCGGSLGSRVDEERSQLRELM